MAPITNLYARYVYPTGLTELPIVVAMHGFNQKAGDMTYTQLRRMSANGCFVMALGMRGRDSATGTGDASGREIQDIYDAVTYVRTNFASVVSQTHLCVAGYSGGGGNALAFACKFPDAASVIVTHFGIADYGYDNTNGWYNSGGTGDRTTLQSWIGGTPAQVPDNYRSRNAPDAIANFSGGHLYLFHDDQDSSVPVINSQRIVTALTNAGMSNYTANYTTVGNIPRWSHGLANDTLEVIGTEVIWAAAVGSKIYAPWTIAAAGTVTVLGYIVTKRFSIWLGTGTTDVATVAYDTVAGTYTVTPLTGSMDVVIRQGARTATQTISGVTTLTVA